MSLFYQTSGQRACRLNCKTKSLFFWKVLTFFGGFNIVVGFLGYVLLNQPTVHSGGSKQGEGLWLLALVIDTR